VAARIEGIPREKIVVIPNGVDLERFKPRDLYQSKRLFGIDEDSFVIASVGRLSQEKGHRHLFEALAAARPSIPKVTCLMAGDGPLRDTLVAQVRALGLEKVCRFLGDVADVESVLAAADVMVLPSIFEGMPNALLEAMAMGCPVIATAVGGSKELVRPGETGLLVPPRDTASLASALEQFALSFRDHGGMRRRIRDIAAASYGIDSMVRSLEQLYLDQWNSASTQSGSR